MYEMIYEYFASKKCAFGKYLQLMADFIKGLKDVKHLINCGVIKNDFAPIIMFFKCGIICKMKYPYHYVQKHMKTWCPKSISNVNLHYHWL
jgi:hypothetical protein